MRTNAVVRYLMTGLLIAFIGLMPGGENRVTSPGYSSLNPIEIEFHYIKP